GRGIGKRLALGLAEAGCQVALVARTESQLQLAQLEIEAKGGVGIPFAVDLCDEAAVTERFQQIQNQLGAIDILITAAGTQGPIGPFWETDMALWKRAIDTNLLGVMLPIRLLLPGMVARRRGKVIVLGGRGISHARPYFTAYAA